MVESDQAIPGAGMDASYVNRYQLWANSEVVRFVIGDSVQGSDVQYKHAFVMTRADAETLAVTLLGLLSETSPTKDIKG